MARWLNYMGSRFPLASYLLIAGGITLSGSNLYASPSGLWPCLTLFSLLLFFFELRLMDELKDYEKDKIAHPERPLPSGLLSTSEVRKVVNRVGLGMGALSIVFFAIGRASAGGLYALITIYLWAMYKEFGCGAWLGKRPLLYAISHQLILLLLCAFAVSVPPGDEMGVWAPRTWAYGWSVLGAFFAYEVCRKLDPRAHPILKTYLSVYGAQKTTAIVLGCSIVSFFGSYQLGLSILGIFHLTLLLSLVLLWKRPERFKLAESLATLSLIAHLWAPFIEWGLRWI